MDTGQDIGLEENRRSSDPAVLFVRNFKFKFYPTFSATFSTETSSDDVDITGKNVGNYWEVTVLLGLKWFSVVTDVA